MVNIDDLDLGIISILKGLGDDEEVTTCDIAKQVLKPKNTYELRTSTSLIQKRLTKLAKYGLIIISKRGKFRYALDDDCCHNALILNLKGRWHTFQL